MGQRESKQHSPLTFGYVDDTHALYHREKADVNTLSEDTNNKILLDHVLHHPELYKLETMCKCTHTTTPNNLQTIASSNNNSNDEGIPVTQQQEECRTCQQTKRLSIDRQHLVRDLEYIDETYYADIRHYEYAPNNVINLTPHQNRLSTVSTIDDGDSNNDNDDDHINESWGKITVGEVTSQTTRHTVTLPGANDHQGEDGTTFTARSTTVTLDLSGRSLVKLSSGIGYLSNLTKLNLSNNQLSTLPNSIGYLGNLTILNTAHNQLETLPDTMAHLTKLKAMNICHNNLTHLPPCLGSLPELIIIIANNNQIRWIPNEIANLQQMISFNISNNPLLCLPAEMANIKSLRKLIAEECDFQTEFISKRQHNPPTLFEQCARTIVQHQLVLPAQLPDHIRNYLSTHQACSYCHGPYFESFVTRGRFIERMARQPIALEYRLCRAHWSDDQDRLLNLFSSSPPVAGQPELSLGDDSASLPDTSAGARRKLSESGSSNKSSLYRAVPALPRLPGLNICSGNTNSSPLPSTTTKQQQQRMHRPKTNSLTKRVAHFLSSPSNSSSSKLMQPLPSHSSLHQEITPTTMADQKENNIHSSLGDEQSIYPSSSSYRTKAGVAPSLYTSTVSHVDEQLTVASTATIINTD